MQPSKRPTCGAGGASSGESRLSCRVVAFKEKDWVWVAVRGCGFTVVKMTAQHCDELRCVFERVDADERGILLPCDVTQGTGLHGGRPFEVPPEPGGSAVASCGRQAGVAACNAIGNARDQVGNWACLGCVGRRQRALNEMEVAAEVASDVVEERAAVD